MWEVAIRPAEPRGVHVVLVDGDQSSHVAWVAYRRWRSEHPFVTFRRALRRAIFRAQQEADDLNGEGMAMERKWTP